MMNFETTILKNISNAELLSRTEKLAHTERKITHLILLHIAEIEDRKLYAEQGFDGMYSYLTRGLGYSEGSAYRRLKSARLLKQIPVLAEKIQDGSLNLSQLTQVQKGIQECNKNGHVVSASKTLELLTQLEHKNTFESKKILAQEMNLPSMHTEILKPQKDDSVRIEFTLTKEQFAELEQAKSLLSHICTGNSWAEVIYTLAQQYNRKKLGTSKLTQRILATKSSSNAQKAKRAYISINTKRSLFEKAQHNCE